MATTARADIVAGFTTMMNAYIALHPTVVKRHFRIRPPSLDTDLPCTYLDLRPETVAYTSGTQTRTFSPSLVVVDRLTDNSETIGRFDLAVDSLIDYIGGYGGPFGGHITASSVWSNMTVTDESGPDGESYFAVVRLAFPDLSIVEGRPNEKAAFLVAVAATPEQIVNALHGIGLIVEVQAVTATAEQVVYACQARGMLAGMNPLTATPEQIVLALIAAGIMEAS
jgi:hypothetical protein